MIHDEYAAGLFDGEGSIGIYRNKGSKDSRYRSGKRGPCWIRSVAINMCWKPILLEFSDRFGGSVKTHRDNSGKRNKVLWQWKLGSRASIVSFLTVICPHLREKREQAETMLLEISGDLSTQVACDDLKRLKKVST